MSSVNKINLVSWLSFLCILINYFYILGGGWEDAKEVYLISGRNKNTAK